MQSPFAHAETIATWDDVLLLFLVADLEVAIDGERAGCVLCYCDGDEPEVQDLADVLQNLNAHLVTRWSRLEQVRRLSASDRREITTFEQELAKRLRQWARDTRGLARDVGAVADRGLADSMTGAAAAAEALLAALDESTARLQRRYLSPPSDPLGLCQQQWNEILWARDQIRAALDVHTRGGLGMTRSAAIQNLLASGDGGGVDDLPDRDAWTRVIIRFAARIRPGESDRVVADVLKAARRPPRSDSLSEKSDK